MKKVLILTIALIFAIILTGCFDVERNNPFDPDSDLPDSEKMVTVKGHTYRGYSDSIIAGVNITIGDKTTVSDSSGYYSIDIMPGTYMLTAANTNWITEQYQITVNSARKTSSQQEDISMFLYLDYFDTYTVGDAPTSPWYYDIYTTSGTGHVLIYDTPYNEMNLFLDDYYDGNAYVSAWMFPTDVQNVGVENIVIGLLFHKKNNTFTETGFNLMYGANEFLYLSISETAAGNGIIKFIDPSGTTIITSLFDKWEEVIYFEVEIYPTNTKLGELWISDNNGILFGSPYNLDFGTNINDVDLINFFINVNDLAVPPLLGELTVESLEIY
ncbi:carboxypeptidase regulatory-like domain-containing protein [Candidatus Dependentiae bacterium]|nr:carboxypeptidase regulatory-like domain-containing protein [Candidatus Dependentiae bacterium]